MNRGHILYVLVRILQVMILIQTYPTKSERNFYTESEEVNSEVVIPRIYRKASFGNEFLLVVKTSKETHYIQLHPVDSDQLLRISYQETLFPKLNNGCLHFHGKLLTGDSGVAAISLCDTGRVSGVILKENNSYIVRPLEPEMQKRDLAAVIAKEHDVVPHVIYNPQNQYKSFCGLEASDYDEEKDKLRRKRVRRADTSGRKIIETAVYVDYPLYKKLSSSHSRGSVMGKIRNAVLAIVNEVQLIYNYNSLRTKFKIVVVKLEVLSENKEAPDPADGDIDQYLDNFCAWQSLRNPPVSSKDHWDHALMLTGLNLHKTTSGGIRNEKVLGLAWVNGMCRPHHSCTLNEGSSFEAAFVIAHEMGHSLGMLHDGRGNDCDPNIYLMSEKTGPGKITWSSCSNEYLDKFFEKGYGSCLEDDNSPAEENLNHEGELPGHRFSLADQCKLSLGENFKPHIVPKPPFDDVCRELWCVSGLWASVAHPALEGSVCGNGKHCHQGSCQEIQSTSRLQILRKEMSSDIKGTVADFLDRLKSAFKILAT